MTASDADTKGRISRAARWDVAEHDRETAWRRNLWVAPFPEELRKRKAVDLRCISRADVAVGRCDGHSICISICLSFGFCPGCGEFQSSTGQLLRVHDSRNKRASPAIPC